MVNKKSLENWVVEALTTQGGSAALLDVAKRIWSVHASDLEASGDLFYTWQYDMRWAANQLRRKSLMKSAEISPPGIWELTGS